jgi:hypothetical protein
MFLAVDIFFVYTVVLFGTDDFDEGSNSGASRPSRPRPQFLPRARWPTKRYLSRKLEFDGCTQIRRCDELKLCVDARGSLAHALQTIVTISAF